MNLVTASLLNVLSTYPASASPAPKLVAITSVGLSPRSHAKLPLVLRPVYSIAWSPHDDKYGCEYLLMHALGRPWPTEDPVPKKGIMPESWKEKLGQNGAKWDQVVVLKPALLTDGSCKADSAGDGKPPYRLSEEDLSAYRISRKDVAHFIAEQLLSDWEKWSGKFIRMAY